MALYPLTIKTNGERFYDITDQVRELFSTIKANKSPTSGVLYLFLPHTSCALTINESYDPSAKDDMENFLKKLAPRNLSWYQHTMEGPDDSPSHMKSILLQNHLVILIEEDELVLGRWQGIYLAEFRDAPHQRNIQVKFIEES
jgi:secondary thiamine-phosphate synthase enzyme